VNFESLKIPLLILVVAAVCAALHWLVGLAQRRLARRFAFTSESDSDSSFSFKRLLLDWTANAVRTLIWILFYAFLIDVLPGTHSEISGVRDSLSEVRKRFLAKLLDPGVGLVVVTVFTVFVMRFASALIRAIFQIFERGAAHRDDLATRRRLQTLSATFRGITQTVILFIGLMIFLKKLGADVTPILASAGVVGIAVGLGAQSLIKDFFAGLLILLEDQYSVGDSVKIGDTSGTVELLTLRVTRVRGLDGSLTMIPNGGINAVVNFSKGWARVVLDVDIDYKEDVDRAMNVMLETAKRMWEENPAEIIEEPKMLGVDKLGGSSVTLRLLAKTKANKQADIGRELRRRVKLAFDREGILSPSSTQQLVLTGPIEEKIAERERGNLAEK
jgi:small conductance mechanosensitive channel